MKITSAIGCQSSNALIDLRRYSSPFLYTSKNNNKNNNNKTNNNKQNNLQQKEPKNK